MGAHAHEPAYFSFILQGAYDEGSGARRMRTCRRANLVYHPPDENHRVEFHAARVRIFRVELSTALIDRLRQGAIVLRDPCSFDGGWPTHLAARIYHEFQHEDTASSLAIEGLALELVAETARRAASESAADAPNWLERARDFLHEHYAEPIQLSQLAAAIDVHPVTLARAFRRRYGETVGEYLRRLRIEAACRHMTETRATLAEVALAAGFYDQSHFTRLFHRITGLTPAEYRAGFNRR